MTKQQVFYLSDYVVGMSVIFWELNKIFPFCLNLLIAMTPLCSKLFRDGSLFVFCITCSIEKKKKMDRCKKKVWYVDFSFCNKYIYNANVLLREKFILKF